MPHHVVVDGSNLATEGRAMPSLAQLQDAVMAFIDEHSEALITVVVDATFGHRIDASEVKEFDAAVANNEVVAPPAGAIGRGDAFLLSIANKVGATVLSNDSFQEFHGTYMWLFDEGRLIGGKPVPHIGWVFVARVPVRGQISRTAVKEAKRKKPGPLALALPAKTGKRQTSPEASRPMPVPKAPPPNATVRGAHAPAAAAVAKAAPAAASTGSGGASTASTKATAVNELMPFLSFVELHPVGTIVNATVESYSSHGAYVRLVGDVVGYVPLRMMADPAPRSAREFLTLGDAVTLVVESFAPTRRSIDLATVAMATAKPPVPRKPTARAAKEAAKRAAQELAEAVAADAVGVDVTAAPVVAAAVVDDTPTAGKATRGRRGGARRGKGGASDEATPDTTTTSSVTETPAAAAAPVEPVTQAVAAVAPKKRAKKAAPAAASVPAAAPVTTEPAAVAPRKRAAKQVPRAAAAAVPAAPAPEPITPVVPAKAAPVAKKARATKRAPAAVAAAPSTVKAAAPAKAPRRRRVAD